MHDSQHNFHDLAEKAVQLHQSGKLRDAAAAYHEILARYPGQAAIIHNLGVIAASEADHESAIDRFAEAIKADSHYLPAHFHRAASLEALGRMNDAIDGYERVCRLDPGHYGAHRRLGFLWLAKGDTGRSLDHFARTYELRRGEDRSSIACASLARATRDKLFHDGEQFRFLARERPNLRRFSELARTYEALARGFPETSTELTDEQVRLLGEDFNTPIHIADAPELTGPVLAPRPATDIEALDFSEAGPSAVVFDDFLTPAALDGLRTYLLCSTIWHDFTHIEGHVASYIEDGLACPLFLQIAAEVRRSFPEALSDHPLCQAWAFKGLHSASAIGAHADDAAVSINLWVTPGAANAGADGGMTICLEPPPPEWSVKDYAADEIRSARLMDRHAGNSLRVAYRENRAVMFASRLLHRSDNPRFSPGYENHRINITLLFGSGTQPGQQVIEL